jgi:uncharacterized protein (TIGR01777 family)
VHGTRNLVEAMLRAKSRPRVFVCSSGISYYGDAGDAIVDESTPRGAGFLADVTVAWEGEALRATDLGVRVVCMRTGIVLGESGGTLEKMITAFKLFAGGPIGGPQYLPWIHLDDMVAVALFAIDTTALVGVVNAVAPKPVRMREFARELGRALRRPSWAPVPRVALRAVMGEMADEILQSQNARPTALERAGFAFRYSEIGPAVRAAVGKGS